jgi:peptide chain release factor subunit 1
MPSEEELQREEDEKAIELFKIKKLITSLQRARGNGTSMISLILPPKSQISLTAKMLSDEYGTASNIKSRVNRLSVLTAITSAQQRLKLYNRCPENGLVIYCGEVVTDEGKIRKISIDFEPFRPINTSLYLCDNKFHTEALTELLQDDAKFGFIVMDGNGSLYGTICGNAREILHKFSVDLPKKHGRGGQSSVRFARLRVEARHNYVRKVSEMATSLFIKDDKATIAGLVLAGSAEFKQQLTSTELLDPRLVDKIVKVVDIAYGGENGFNQAIELAAESLANVKLVQEKKLINKYFDEIAQDTGKFCFAVRDTMTALELSSVETLIVWEDLETQRWEFKNAAGKVSVVHGNPTADQLKDPETGLDLELVDKQSLVEWFTNNYKTFGCRLEFITNRSQEGAQFCKGFGGIGGILRWRVDFIAITDVIDSSAAKEAIAQAKALAKAAAAKASGGAIEEEEAEVEEEADAGEAYDVGNRDAQDYEEFDFM